MATQTPAPTVPTLDPAAVADFQTTLRNATRIVAVLGAGLSASSGLPTYRGAGGLWRSHDVTTLDTKAAFLRDPGLVWKFYASRRTAALAASPNAAHVALADLAKRVPGFVALTQNVDDLSPRAGHPLAQLVQLHGNLFDLRCCDAVKCGYVERGNVRDPLVPALSADAEDRRKNAATRDPENPPKANVLLLEGIARKNRQILGDGYRDEAPTVADTASLRAVEGDKPSVVAAEILERSGIDPADLPRCPQCGGASLLRPHVVWFGEGLPADVVAEVDGLFAAPEPVDLCLVVGTSSQVWPAAGYAEQARKKGARIAVVNPDAGAAKNRRPGTDWLFQGDAAVVVPELLRPVIGGIEKLVQEKSE
ncbi:DHS-like NAD/FAD-binding domain-containing protein [Whalleya microplaca]|nr:DHS-like NAD/FAD-binding domain-containing protein [Whalleya microplaca]